MTMTEAQWLASTDPQEMLRFLEGKVSERKLRLFACAWWRSLEPHDEEYEIVAVAMEQRQEYQDPDTDETIDAAWLFRDCTSNPRHGVRGANLLRDIAGNPCRPWNSQPCPECRGTGEYELLLVGNGTVPCPECGGMGWEHDWETELSLEGCLRWHDGIVPRLAEAIYDERAWDRMPILADALEEAGCDNEDILQHCRGGVSEYKDGARWYFYTDTSGPQLTSDYARAAHVHIRGCWVIDLLLGKS
jgi:hypothetical protein